MSSFEIDIPMKDHPLVITVKQADNAEPQQKFDLYYCGELCGYIFCNEHNVWIYEPHQHAGLLLDADQIQHLGKEIGKKSKC